MRMCMCALPKWFITYKLRPPCPCPLLLITTGSIEGGAGCPARQICGRGGGVRVEGAPTGTTAAGAGDAGTGMGWRGQEFSDSVVGPLFGLWLLGCSPSVVDPSACCACMRQLHCMLYTTCCMLYACTLYCMRQLKEDIAAFLVS